MNELRAFSSGGGVQSTAALVLSAQGRIDFPVHLFSNVGDDSEHPATLAYVRDVLIPYADAHGVEYHELRRIRRDGVEQTLYGKLTANGSRSIPIPVRVANGAPGTRQCTFDFKLRVIDRWLRDQGASTDNVPTIGIGFSTDEIERVGSNAGKSRRLPQHKVYPLLELGLSRADCQEITRKANLPPAPKSSCWFCPFHKPSTWREMARDEPVLFRKAVELENLLNDRRETLNKDHVFFTRFGRPLDEAIHPAQDALFADADGWGESCDEGVCFV